jgi:hypothetical protein
MVMGIIRIEKIKIVRREILVTELDSHFNA